MSTVTNSQVEHPDFDDDDDDDRPWYRSPSVLIPIASGIAFAALLSTIFLGESATVFSIFYRFKHRFFTFI